MSSLRAALFLAAALGLAGCALPTPQFDNLVLIVVDTLRSDHLSSYGYERATAPFLTQLAAEGIQVQGVSATSWTKPSVATLLTGLHPQRHRTNSRIDKVPANVALLAEILAARGMATAGYTSNRFAGKDFGFDRGFARWSNGQNPLGDLDPKAFANPLSSAKAHADWVSAVGLELARDLETRFFLSLHYLDPHDPYTAKASWNAAPTIVQPADFGARAPTEVELAALVEAYDATIADFDRALERLIAGLEAAGRLEKTLVVITSDHGEEFFEHGHLTHGKALFEESLRVPLIFWARAGLRPWRSDVRFHQVDFLPTVLQALGLEVPPGLDGTAAWPELSSGFLRSRSGSLHQIDLDGRAALAWVEGSEKIIHQRALPYLPQPTNLFFDLASDPLERQTLGDRWPQRERLTRALLARHGRLNLAPVERNLGGLELEARAELQALGYVGPGETNEDLAELLLPRRLDFYDAHPYGLFGHEPLAELSARLDLNQPSLGRRFGWPGAFGGPGDGRQASIALRLDQDSRRVVVRARTKAKDSQSAITFRWRDRILAKLAGQDLTFDLPEDARGRHVFQLDLDVEAADATAGRALLADLEIFLE